MNYIEMPLWVAIVFAAAFVLLLIHTIIGDLLGKILYKYLKDKIEMESKDE
jgi:hypothetical protein